GLWKSRPRAMRKKHCWRERRSCCGELVQWDTSTHDWIEGRGQGVRYLVRMIDDATSRSWGRFVPADGTRENMGVLWEYLERNGRPGGVVWNALPSRGFRSNRASRCPIAPARHSNSAALANIVSCAPLAADSSTARHLPSICTT